MSLFSLICLIILTILSFYLLADIITHFIKLKILEKSVKDAQKIVHDDIVFQKKSLDSNVSQAILKAKSSMKGK